MKKNIIISILAILLVVFFICFSQSSSEKNDRIAKLEEKVQEIEKENGEYIKDNKKLKEENQDLESENEVLQEEVKLKDEELKEVNALYDELVASLSQEEPVVETYEEPVVKTYEEPVVEESYSSSYSGEVLSSQNGRVPTLDGLGTESYYNLDMSGVVEIMRGMGYDEENYPYWVRDDGCKMLGDYIMCAANLDIYPRGSIVQLTLGAGLVCDTGSFINWDPYGFDIATAW